MLPRISQLKFNHLLQAKRKFPCLFNLSIYLCAYLFVYLKTSVADPDPDSVGSGLFGKIQDPDPLPTKIQIFSL